MTRLAPRTLMAAVMLPVAIALTLVVMPKVTGTGWDVTGDRVANVPLHLIWQLVAVWAGGLWLHTLVLRGSLPGLGTRRALALNLGGSSVSNVLPFGGAAGVGLNYAMLRSWGYSAPEISAFATVSNVVVTVVKGLIAVAGLVAVLRMPTTAEAMRMGPSWVMAAGVAAIVALALALLSVTVCSTRGRARLRGIRAAVRQTAAMSVRAVRRGWRLIAVGGLGYPTLQALLLWLCLQAAGASVAVIAAVTAFAVERLLTLVPFTPGGVGIAEAGTTASLVALGADPAGAAAGVILFRVFSFFIEIPLGGLIAWFWFARSVRRRTGSTSSSSRGTRDTCPGTAQS